MGHLFKPGIPRDICEICGTHASNHKDGFAMVVQMRKEDPVVEADFLRAENQRLREALASAVRASGIEDGDTAESVRRGFVKLGELAVAMVAARDVLK